MDQDKTGLNVEGEETPGVTGQTTDKSLAEELALEAQPEGEETLETVKARLAKVERDRDNYREGLLKYKKEGLPEKDEADKEEDEEAPPKDAADVVEQTVQKVLERNHEREARDQFLSRYPALKDPERWKQVLVNLPTTVDKSSPEGVLKALEGALLLTNHYTGKKFEDREADLSDLATVSQGGSRRSEASTTPDVKESTAAMGTRFKHSVDALAKEDDSTTAEISF